MPEEEASILGLATIRRNRGISLEQIAQLTKISVRSLQAIERGDFKKLPGGIYTISYLRQYAKAIDFDEDELLAFYSAETGCATGSAATKPQRNGNIGGGFRPASIIN